MTVVQEGVLSTPSTHMLHSQDQIAAQNMLLPLEEERLAQRPHLLPSAGRHLPTSSCSSSDGGCLHNWLVVYDRTWLQSAASNWTVPLAMYVGGACRR